jgi:hypothetical protein
VLAGQGLILLDPQRKTQATLSVNPEGAGLRLDAQGKPRTQLLVFANGTPVLQVMDARGALGLEFLEGPSLTWRRWTEGKSMS